MQKVHIEGLDKERWVTHMVKLEPFDGTVQRLNRIASEYNVYGTFQLYYLDSKGDRIALTSEEDWILFGESRIEEFFAKVVLSPAELALSSVVASRSATSHISNLPFVSNEPVEFGSRDSLPYLETGRVDHVTCYKPYLPHAPGVTFQKVWRVFNSHKPWPEDTAVVFLSRPGDISMAEGNVFPVGEVATKTNKLIVINMKAPLVPGGYRGCWSLARRNAEGKWVRFGSLLTIRIEVVNRSTVWYPNPNTLFHRHEMQIGVLLKRALEEPSNELHALAKKERITISKSYRAAVKLQLAQLGVV